MVMYLFLDPSWSPNSALGEHLVHLEPFPGGVGNIEAEQNGKEILNETLEKVVILCLAIA